MSKQEKIDGKLAFIVAGELDYDLVADVDQAWGAYRLHLVAKELNTKVRQAIELHAYHSWEYSTTTGPMKWTEQVYLPLAPFPKITIRNCLRLWRLELLRWLVTKSLPKGKVKEGAIQWVLRRRESKVEYHERLFQREENEKVLQSLCECAVAQASFLIERGCKPQMVLLGSRSGGVLMPLFKYKVAQASYPRVTVPGEDEVLPMEPFEQTRPALRLEIWKPEHIEKFGADHMMLPVLVDHALNEDAVLVV